MHARSTTIGGKSWSHHVGAAEEAELDAASSDGSEIAFRPLTQYHPRRMRNQPKGSQMSTRVSEVQNRTAETLLIELGADGYRCDPTGQDGYAFYEFKAGEQTLALVEMHRSGFIKSWHGVCRPATCVYCGQYESEHIDDPDECQYADEPTEAELTRNVY